MIRFVGLFVSLKVPEKCFSHQVDFWPTLADIVHVKISYHALNINLTLRKESTVTSEKLDCL